MQTTHPVPLTFVFQKIQMVVNYDPHKHEVVTTTVKVDVDTDSPAVPTKGLPCWIMKPEESQEESVELIAGDKEVRSLCW